VSSSAVDDVELDDVEEGVVVSAGDASVVTVTVSDVAL
jgi:hypothetical protein